MTDEDKPIAPIKLFIDVSGTPFNKVYIGLCGMNVYQAYNIEKEFRIRHPEYSRKKSKASQLNSDQLFEILRFHDSMKMRMCSICIEQNDWLEYKRRYGKKAYWKERIFAIYYFILLRAISSPRSRRKGKFEVVTCKESFMDINKVLESCKRLSGAYNRDFDFYSGLHKLVYGLKFADHVAAAQRKLDIKRITQLNNYRVVSRKPEALYFLKLFGKIEK